MKFTSTFTVAILAIAAIAAPTEPTYGTVNPYPTTTTKKPVPTYGTSSTTKPTTVKTTTKPPSVTTTTKSATPTTSATPQPTCPDGKVVACCNTSDVPITLPGGLGGLIGGLLQPGTCLPILGPLLDGLIGTCGSATPFCCTNNQNGLINLNLLQCVAIII